jgi:hypothetical protein
MGWRMLIACAAAPMELVDGEARMVVDCDAVGDDLAKRDARRTTVSQRP